MIKRNSPKMWKFFVTKFTILLYTHFTNYDLIRIVKHSKNQNENKILLFGIWLYHLIIYFCWFLHQKIVKTKMRIEFFDDSYEKIKKYCWFWSKLCWVGTGLSFMEHQILITSQNQDLAILWIAKMVSGPT